MSYLPPNYTQVPNVLLDDHLSKMKEAELKVTLAIARKTFGWHKQADQLSLTQLMDLTGMSNQGVRNGINAGIKRGTIRREAVGQSFTYHLVVNPEAMQPSSAVNEPAMQPSSAVLCNEVAPQKKDIKKGDLNKKDHQKNADDQPPASLLRSLIEGAGFIYIDKEFTEVATRLEAQYETAQLVRAVESAKAAHQKKIGKGERGITAPLAYIAQILADEPAKRDASPKQRFYIPPDQYSTEGRYVEI